ncbi:hypothetical protein [Roseinatronobacter sp.]|uniref:hypothetical protein n=1 Tax=Roseinatronobacter sp. TaxID=1945755 RepID=UPI0025EF2E1E|nr:hypothetical protein [Rhodobaca sp.]
MRWRGEEYHIDLSADVAHGFEVDLEHERAKRKPFRNAYDRALARIDHLEGILSKRIVNESGSQADDVPIAGRMTSEKPIEQLRIERQANGGWLIESRDEVNSSGPFMTRSDVTGAFTSTADMLRALADLLERDDEKRKEQADG